jgi:hypothetical protein
VGLIVPSPQPLATCPGRALWERYRGEEWLVFMDESFFMFFELTARTGYFGHAAVGVPAREYGALKAAIAPIFADYAALTAQGVSEFKHTAFKRLDYKDRRRLAQRLRDALTSHGAFIAGFFTPVRPFVLEHVRTNLMFDGITELPEDHQALVDEAIRELLAQHKGPGQSGVISKLLSLAVGGVANMLASFEAGFKIICDPREKKEDNVVRASVADFVAVTKDVEGIDLGGLRTDLHTYLRGIESSKASDEELGLQLADLTVGELCEFFKANPELMSYKASMKLVTPTSREPVMTGVAMQGYLLKGGALHRMPPALRARLTSPDPKGRTVLTYFRNLFAAGILTCYSSLGQPRDLIVFEGLIWDQCE